MLAFLAVVFAVRRVGGADCLGSRSINSTSGNDSCFGFFEVRFVGDELEGFSPNESWDSRSGVVLEGEG